MRPGWNANRRNRNIGTEKAGHGQDNRLTIPCTRGDGYRLFWAKLTSYTTHARDVNGRRIVVLVEPPRPGSFHACSVNDLFHLLGQVPAEDREGLDLYILRQPKRKEETLRSCWGRLACRVEIDEHEGPAVMLEAQDLSKPCRWPKKLGPDDLAELERLREDGHRIELTRHHYVIERSAESIRATQLYRTLLHEIGHWADQLRCVQRPSREPGADWLALWERHYEQKPAGEREQFAHAYAHELGASLRARGIIPFGPIPDRPSDSLLGR